MRHFYRLSEITSVVLSIVGSLCDREVACSASDLQGMNFESCVLRAVSSQASHYPQEVPLAQFSLYVHKSDLKSDSFHYISMISCAHMRPITNNMVQRLPFARVDPILRNSIAKDLNFVNMNY